MRVAIFSTKFYEEEYMANCPASNKHDLHYFNLPLNTETASNAIGFTAVSIMLSDKLDEAAIRLIAANGVLLIALRSAGFDNVDINAAAKFGIRVVRVPAYSPQAIAEHAMALILTLNRKTHKAYNRVRENNFSLQNLMGFNLFQKNIGVIGTGKIGRAFCKIALGFGCHVFAYDIKQSSELIALGVQYISLDSLLSSSDIISIHCPLNKETHHLCNTPFFNKMKKGAMLINTGRGGIVNTADAIQALKTGQLGYVGMDVYEGEANLFFKDLSASIIQDDLIERLLSFNNVLVTPHQGYFTKEALSQIAETTIQNFSDFEAGLPLKNEVLPQT